MGGKYTKASRNTGTAAPYRFTFIAEIQLRQKMNLRFKDRLWAHYWLFLLSAHEQDISIIAVTVAASP